MDGAPVRGKKRIKLNKILIFRWKHPNSAILGRLRSDAHAARRVQTI
jgi:hypothetical protein